MAKDAHQEYDSNLTTVLETLWGEGFLSPGGTAEVDAYLDGIDLQNKSLLDIGCGLGGVDLYLARRYQPADIVGIDIDSRLIASCKKLASRHKLADLLEFVCVEPGPLPFDAASFDVVTSKDSIIHIADKAALARDIFRVLKPGGWFVASDWLAGYDGETSAQMREYLAAEGLDFGLADATGYRQALADAGFTDVSLVDRNAWYAREVRIEFDKLVIEQYADLTARIDPKFVDHQIDVWKKLIRVVDSGELRPTHLRGRKPL